MKNNTKKVVYLGLFVALEVVLSRFVSIQTPLVRIGFSFIPVAISSMMFGPLFGGITAAIADIMGIMIFPAGGAYFPGFTLSAFLSGTVYGLLLYNKPKNFLRIGIAVTIVSIFINLGLGSVWLWMVTGKSFMVILPPRVIKNLVMIPIEIPIIEVTWRLAVGRINLNYSH